MAFVITAVTAEVVTFAAVAAAVSELGIAMTVVGAVTGSKELTKWGGILGLAGGIGSLAAGAVSAGTSAAEGAAGAVADSAPTAMDTIASGLGSNSIDSIGTAAADAGSASTDLSLLDGASSGASPSLSGADLLSGPHALPGTAPPSTGIIQGQANGLATDTTTAAPVASPSDTSTAFSAAKDSQAYNSTLPNGGVVPPTDTSSSGIVQWFKSLDPKTQSTVLQTGSGMVSGLFNGWSAEQKQALAQNQFNLEQQKYNTTVANANAQPTINFKPVGIINTAKAS